MKELAANQLALVEGVELQNHDFDRLIIHGTNLYNFWKTIDFRRLAESDLPAKKYLFDSAKTMARSCIQEDQAAIVMLLLLLNLFNHRGPALGLGK